MLCHGSISLVMLQKYVYICAQLFTPVIKRNFLQKRLSNVVILWCVLSWYWKSGTNISGFVCCFVSRGRCFYSPVWEWLVNALVSSIQVGNWWRNVMLSTHILLFRRYKYFKGPIIFSVESFSIWRLDETISTLMISLL